MAEKLIPFDFKEFCADPMRLRHEKGYGPIWASRAQDHAAVCVVWDGNDYASAYIQMEFNKLRLVAKACKVKVRLYLSAAGNKCAVSEFEWSLRTALCFDCRPWCSEIFEIEALK